MTRRVRFCGACGARIPTGNRTLNAPIAYCNAHSDLPRLDAPPPDPLESLPMQADEPECESWTFRALDGSVVATFDGDVPAMMEACDALADATGVPIAAYPREDTHPATGSED